MGGKAHKFDLNIAKQVEVLSAVGIPQDQIGYIVGLTSKTIRKYYREQLDNGKAKVDGAIGGQLVKKALAGDTTSIIFYLKTRCGWSEKQEVEHTGNAINIMLPSASIEDYAKKHGIDIEDAEV